ncbi:MAG: IS200/IS605 family transposase [Opitutales bacterium]|nr:IS200/IS605 family transposase [Opitutales bacterium]
MPQSHSNILVHLVFSTKNRAPALDDSWRDELHGYVGGILRRSQSHLLAGNSVADHIHLLFPLPRTVCVADLFKEIKTGSTKWIQNRDSALSGFHWQSGYGAFSISPGHKDAVRQYIANQAGHHRTVSFQEEYRRLLDTYGIEYDERYVWD